MDYLCPNSGQYISAGHPNQHVLASEGADSYLMNFYVTQNSSTYRPPRVKPKANILGDKSLTTESLSTQKLTDENKKTGFVDNERYYLPYTRSIDELDNPTLGRMCTKNYQTSHQAHYQPYELPDGTESMPPNTSNQTSGFFREHIVHNPNSSVPPIGGKEATTYGSNFAKPAQLEPVTVGQVGPKETSGFVANTEIEPLTATTGERWHYHTRPTGSSEYKDRFPQYDYPKGDDPLLTVIDTNTKISSDRVINNFVLPTGDGPYAGGSFGPDSTEYRQRYVGNQFLPEKMGQLNIGPKETTGTTRNDNGFNQQFDDPRRFITTYQMNHFDMNAKGRDREGYVVGGVQKPRATGFSQDTKTANPLDNFRDERVTRYHLDSYQVRSLRARDPFFADATHDNKGRLQKQSELF
ncbi:unnamed protein product [Rotaria socialis]|uniref:Protein phosphatase 1 regulatory subunit 32 n=4 Tax=Rotaria TaxID=231623 RepID=A0A816S8K2_9BILA|nr:unnamed protein product [Rotaria magnacalcarata]CAF3235328.1 unnamed protein product [Rotaria socialis]CAF2207134.1 unnamed protein product [Rotaria magnacalcarata]CAF3327650.1 unnamed protein product [Rotaria socialis]CAF3335309.1 unnamed protein product [Rotaria socialis]